MDVPKLHAACVSNQFSGYMKMLLLVSNSFRVVFEAMEFDAMSAIVIYNQLDLPRWV